MDWHTAILDPIADGRHERLEERLDERAYLIEGYYDEVEDAYEDGLFLYSPFVVYNIDGVWDLD